MALRFASQIEPFPVNRFAQIDLQEKTYSLSIKISFFGIWAFLEI